MKRNLGILALAASLLLVGCQPKNEKISQTNYQLGTVISYEIFDSSDTEIIQKGIKRVDEIENKMSLNIPESELNHINQKAFHQEVALDDELKNILATAFSLSEETKGLFDVSVGSLVQLWGIGSDHARVPSQKEIDEAIKHVGYQNVQLTKEGIKYSKEGIVIDLGGIAKGYAADEVAKLYKANKVKSALINMGGNVYALGHKPDGSQWRVGIREPFIGSADYCLSIGVEDKAVVTSGYYERYIEKDGKLYHHILNPLTGYPGDMEVLSVTIIAEQSMLADALSTSCYLLGVDKGLELIKKYPGVEAIFISKDKKVFPSEGIAENIELNKDEYKLVRQ